MTLHTDAEFEMMRKAFHMWQETACIWQERALKAEAELVKFMQCRRKVDCLARDGSEK